MDLLDPVVFHDAWGSHIALAILQGRPIPSPEPESELWMGAHESGPSRVVRDGRVTTLDAVVADDPQGTLGVEVVNRFGPRLPFLLKVLAAGRALSIQSHPTGPQARELRDASGSGERDAVYVDDWPKPELLVAVAPFEVFVGLRDAAEVAAVVARLAVPQLDALHGQCQEAVDPVGRLLELVLHVPKADQAAFVREVVAACVRSEGQRDEIGSACSAVLRVAEDHPDDIGLVVLLLMNHRVLHPGEFIDVPAGVLHSYVGGIGIEVLANSDNVVRAGLTDKPVHVEELLRIVDTAADGRAGRSVREPSGLERFPTQAAHFRLARAVNPVDVVVPGTGRPRLVFCLRGTVRLSCGDQVLDLGAAASAFVSASEGPAQVSGAGEVYLVTVGG